MNKLNSLKEVKGPVECIQWLVDNGYIFSDSGELWKPNGDCFPTEYFAFCGKQPPEGWDFPELLEEVK